ncbi:hypothetical protein MtrunA17_Chr7g0227971 [Medicago truncatula]|nr:hypothetical protein MtrunA17_Chr7g0227971 [Medicago truncatula]
MDIILAELHKACLYTVPKHMVYKESIFQSKEAYFRSIGYQSDGENLEECTKNYLDQLKSYMKLYGALVQMAGFALYKRYKSQFLKMLKIISDNFLVDLKSRTVPELNYVELQTCIEEKKFLQVPKGRSMQSKPLSRGILPFMHGDAFSIHNSNNLYTIHFS